MRQYQSLKHWSEKAAILPPLSVIAFSGAHRLVPSKISPGERSPLTRLTTRQDILDGLVRTESKTDNRLKAELGLLPGIGPLELVTNVPCADIINAAFTYTRPEGSRFSGPLRGAWYAAKTVRTAQEEIAYHQTAALWEAGRFEDEVSYDDYRADFAGEYHDLRAGRRFAAALDPKSYRASQALGEALLRAGSLGIIYPSVRHAGGVCIACFRPALATHVRRGRRFMFRWTGAPKPSITTVAVPEA